MRLLIEYYVQACAHRAQSNIVQAYDLCTHFH